MKQTFKEYLKEHPKLIVGLLFMGVSILMLFSSHTKGVAPIMLGFGLGVMWTSKKQGSD